MANEILGNGTLFKLDPAGGASYVEVANQLDGTLTTDVDAVEVTNKASGRNKTYITGNYGFSGSLSGYVTTDPALDLNGTDEFAYVADHNDFDVTDNFAIQAAIRPDIVSAGTRYIVHKTDGSDGYALYQTGDEIALATDGATDGVTTTTNANMLPGQLYIVKASFAAGTVKIYVNEVEKTTSASGSVPAAVGVNATRVTIGADAADGNLFDGKIYSVAIDNAASANTQRLNPTDCVAYWGFEGVLTDSSGNAHTLTGNNLAAADYGDLTLWTIKNAIKNKTTYTLQLAEDGTSLTYTGTVVFTSYSQTNPQNAAAGYTVNFQGSGALTIA